MERKHHYRPRLTKPKCFAYTLHVDEDEQAMIRELRENGYKTSVILRACIHETYNKMQKEKEKTK